MSTGCPIMMEIN